MFPEAKLGIGPPITDGFYYDFDVPRAFTPEDLAALEKRMQPDRQGRPAVLDAASTSPKMKRAKNSRMSRTSSNSSTTSPATPR